MERGFNLHHQAEIAAMRRDIKTLQKREIIQGVLDRWTEQYEDWPDSRMIGLPKEQKTVGSIRSALENLNLNKCSGAEVDAAIGTSGWVENECDICGKDVQILAHLGDEPDYEARWLNVCKPCLKKAVAKIDATKIKP